MKKNLLSGLIVLLFLSGTAENSRGNSVSPSGAISSSLFTSISGLNTMASAISLLGDNIIAAGSAQVGRGVTLSTVYGLFAQGSFESTSTATDLVIGGSGFFILKFPPFMHPPDQYCPLCLLPPLGTWCLTSSMQSTSAAGLDSSLIGGSFSIQSSFRDPLEPALSTPLPGAVWLLGSGLVGLFSLRRKGKGL